MKLERAQRLADRSVLKDGLNPMNIYGPFLKIYGPFETFFGPFLMEQKASSGSVDAATAKKSKNFFLVTDCI